MILCGTELRPSGPDQIETVVRLVGDLGFDGVAVGRGCLLAEASTLIAETLRRGFVPGVLRAPMPEQVLGATRRLPRLGAEAADERAAAIALARRSLDMAGAAGVGVLWLDFGAVKLGSSPTEFMRFFGRRETGKNKPGTQALPDALAERRHRSPALVDACQWSLEALVAESDRWGVTLAMDLAAVPWGLPTPREALTLIQRFGGARVATVLDIGKLSVMRRLGLAMSADRLAAVRAAAALIVENDAVGIDAGYLPGLGERDADDVLPDGPKVPVVVIGASDCTDAEIAAAARLVSRRYA